MVGLAFSLSCNTAQASQTPVHILTFCQIDTSTSSEDIKPHIMDIRGAHWIIVTVNGRPVSLCELGPFVSASGLTVCCLDQCSQARLCPCNGQSSDRVRDFVLVVCNVGRRFTTVMMRLKSWTKCLSFTCVWKTTRWLNYYWYYFRFSLHLAILIKGQVNIHEMSNVMVQIINIS